MKKSLILSLITLITALLMSYCIRRDGKWNDIIQLSTKTAEFNPIGDSVIIKTKGNWWWINGISLDDSLRLNFEGVNVLSDQYKIDGDTYVVERRDLNTLFIKLDANPKKTLRTLKIFLEAGDYFDAVIITQKFQ